MQNVWIGTSGYNYKSWKNVFYPEGLAQKKWLAYYAEHFKTLEINATFYRHFERHVYEQWAERVGENFLFVIKGSRYITHIKRLKEVEGELERQLEAVAGLGKKLGILLCQFPASFKATEETKERISDFLKLLPQKNRYAFELRDKSWFEKETESLFSSHNVSIVINDTTAFDVTHELFGSFAYIRFHGPSALYASSYSDVQLEEWAGKIKEWRDSHEVFCYFNNDISGYAIENANKLITLLKTE